MRFILIFLFLVIFSFVSQSQTEPDTGTTEIRTSNAMKDSLSAFDFFIQKGIRFDSTSNISLYNEIFNWLGVKYRYGGNGKTGTDCSHFAGSIYKRIYGISLPPGSANIYNTCINPIEKGELREGDLVFFRIRKGRISHVAIYLSNNKIVHATTKGGVMIDDLNENYYSKYYFSSGRVKGNKLNMTDKQNQQLIIFE